MSARGKKVEKIIHKPNKNPTCWITARSTRKIFRIGGTELLESNCCELLCKMKLKRHQIYFVKFSTFIAIQQNVIANGIFRNGPALSSEIVKGKIEREKMKRYV